MENTTELERARAVAIDAALRAGRYLRSQLYEEKGTQHKSEIDLVTRADTEAERIVVSRLREAFPGYGLLAEEQGGSAAGGGPRWIVDPLDGTTNFVHGLPHFSVSIALEIDGRIQVGVVYDPCRDELFEATRGRGTWLNGRPARVSGVSRLADALMATGFPYDRRERAEAYLRYVEAYLRTTQGIRRYGSAALDLAYVACGRYDGYWEFNLKPWDVAAGLLLVEEAGGRVVTRDEVSAGLTSREFVAAGTGLLPELLEVFRKLPDPFAPKQ